MSFAVSKEVRVRGAVEAHVVCCLIPVVRNLHLEGGEGIADSGPSCPSQHNPRRGHPTTSNSRFLPLKHILLL